MPTERGRRLFAENPPAYLSDEARADIKTYTVRFARILNDRAGEYAERRRSRVAGPAEVDEAWDAVMRPGRKPALAAVLGQELCVLLAGAGASAAGGVLWYAGGDGAATAAALAVAAVGFAVAAAVLRAGQRG